MCLRRSKLTFLHFLYNLATLKVPFKGKDFCESDRGGPLVCNDKLVGISSFHLTCGAKLFPGVYCNIPKYKTWMQEYADVIPSSTTTTTKSTSTASAITSTMIESTISSEMSTTSDAVSILVNLQVVLVFLILWQIRAEIQ